MLKSSVPKSSNNFYCEKCDYTTSRYSQYIRHLTTLKHKNQQKSTENQQKSAPEEKYLCECLCGKKYRERSGLWRHKKKCGQINKTFDYENSEDSLFAMDDNKDLVMHLLNQNKQLQDQIIEICKDKSITNNNTNNNMNNSHNKTFNLQVFLNETCKDAMNLTDFVDSLQIQISDLEKVGKDGFVAGISNIILKNLKAMDVTMRPVHCSDQKRETMYIKDQNEWHNDSKELPENQKLKKAIKQIAHKNICKIPEWKKMYPDCIYSESRKSDLYNHIMYQAMDHNESNSEKIIKKIAKEVGINK
jgi:hypothetical protein